MISTESGLQYEEIRPSDLPFVRPGHVVHLNYRIALNMVDIIGGNCIDEYEDDRSDKDPIIITVGAGEVLKGVDEALNGMRIGSTRRLILPPHLAFGKRGVPGIVPPNATLYVEIVISTKTAFN